MKEVIAQILTDSVTAPSPDNFQPWKFSVLDNEINVFKVPSEVNHLLDCNQHVLILTVGMLVENIVISASHYGYRCSIQLFPDASYPDLAARIRIHKDSGVNRDHLYDYIKARCTNRKMYKKNGIAPEILDELAGLLRDFPGIEVQFAEDQKDIRQLGNAVSAIDKIMCENKELHGALFQHITWTKEEEQRTNQGLSLDAMELKAADKQMFRLIQKWKVINSLNKIGFSNIIRAKNASQYGSAACGVIISTQNDSQTDYLNAGRFVQRFWLVATQKGLSLHPIVGVIYCTQKVIQENTPLFSNSHAKLLRDNYTVLDSIASANGKTNKHIVFYFRMGYADPPSYQSTRKKPEIVFADMD
jgi:hypothetical protein